DDPRLDLWEARQISHRSEPEAAVVLERGMRNAASRGQKLIYAEAKIRQCSGLAYSEHPDAATPVCQEAYDILLAAGNRTRAAVALRNIADVKADAGKRDEALRLYDQAIHMLRETGSRAALAGVENNMALVLENQGELDRAERLFREVKSDFEEIGD